MPYSTVKTHTSRTLLNRHEPRPPRAPTQHEIACLAYAYWEARGRQAGSPEQDWYRAERELNRIIAVKELAT